jgi:hypothetical protein
MIVTGILCFIALVLVLYRLFNGWMMRKAIHKDDMLIAASMVFFFLLTDLFEFLTFFFSCQIDCVDNYHNSW